jgi:transcriptional regulator of acetoin/glycerol metabolism
LGRFEMREPPPHDDVANEGEGAELSCLEQAAREASCACWAAPLEHRVADELGVSRNIVYRKVERYRLARD